MNGGKPSGVHVVEFKHWVKCGGNTTSGRKQDLVKQWVDLATVTRYELKIVFKTDFPFIFFDDDIGYSIMLMLMNIAPGLHS